MSIIADAPVNATVRPEVLEWVEAVSAIHTQVLSDRIRSLDDPRAQQIMQSGHYPMDDGGETLTRYFLDVDPVLEQIIFMHFTDIPACPIPIPEWADTQEVLLGEWPEITVEHSRTIRAGEHAVRIDEMFSVFAEHVTDRDGPSFLAGEVSESGGTSLVLSQGDFNRSIRFDDFGELSVLGEAILDLARFVDATEDEAAK